MKSAHKCQLAKEELLIAITIAWNGKEQNDNALLKQRDIFFEEGIISGREPVL